MSGKFLVFLIALCVVCKSKQQGILPVVMWHGMGDTCCNPLSLGRIQKIIESTLPGIHVNSLKIGNSFADEVLSGYFANINDQVALACKQIQNDTKLQNGYNALGFSQGGLFLRAVAQRCPTPRMLNLISIGGPQQGVYGFPRCPSEDPKICDEIRKLLDYGAYASFVQKLLVQAQYWHDPVKEDEYRAKSLVLADLNQENKFNADYKENLLRLKNLVLVKFNNDTMIIPKDSEWFGFYKSGQAVEIDDLEHTSLYMNDSLGLKTLDSRGSLFRISTNGDHLQFTDEWFIENIVKSWLV